MSVGLTRSDLILGLEVIGLQLSKTEDDLRQQGLNHQYILAPLLGVTDGNYRQAYMRHFGGFDRAVAPFIKTLAGGRYKAAKLRELELRPDSGFAVEPQIISNNADDFLCVARVLFDLGYPSVNLNLGCPVPMAAGRGRGAGLIPQVDFVDQFLEQIVAKLPGKLSIKTRIGYDSPTQLKRLIPVLNRYPLEELTIHPRTAKDLYGGEVNLAALDELVPDIRHSLVYSGDITSVASLQRLQLRYPSIRKWMIGRGGVRDPFLMPRLRAQALSGSMDRIFEQFYDDLREAYLIRGLGPFQVLQKLKALWFYQARLDILGVKLAKRVRKEKSLSSFMSYVRELGSSFQGQEF